MPDRPILTSLQNPRVKHVARLVRDRRLRDATGHFVAEGVRDVTRARQAGLPLIECFRRADVPSLGEVETIVSGDVLAKMAYRDPPEGYLAVFEQRRHDLADLSPADDGIWLVMVGVEKPGNLGAVARTAAAAGCVGLITAGPNVDVYNPNALRNSTGAMYALPVAVAGSADVQAWLVRHAIRSFATTPAADATSLWSIDWPTRSAVIIGPEHAGLDDAWLAAADERVRIPTVTGIVDSLNAATAAAVVLFAATRKA